MAAQTTTKIDYPTTEAGMLQAAIAEAQDRGEQALVENLSAALAKRTGKQVSFTEASGSTFVGGPVNGHAKPQPTRKASEAQINYIKSLFLRKGGVVADEHPEILAALATLTPKAAHEQIEKLLARPDYVAAQEATAATGATPVASGKRQPVHYPTIPAGWYRVGDTNYKVSQPSKGNWVGWTFIEDEHGDKYRGAAAKELLDAIAADPFKAATDYGHATVVCGCCLTPLEHPASVELGIGPVCAEKYGMGELYADTAARLEGRTRRTRKTKVTNEITEENTVTETKPATRTRKAKATPATAPVAPVAETTPAPVTPKATRTRKTAPKAQEAAETTAPVVESTPAPAKPATATRKGRKAAPAPVEDAPVVVAKAAKGKGHAIPAQPAPVAEEAPLTEELMKARKRAGKCELCGKRSIGTGKASGYDSREYARSRGWCLPCTDESQHEIEHDNGHEGIPTTECWICNPELNAAKEEHTPRAGIAKAGMTIYAKGDKAQVVADAIKAAKGESTHATNKKGITTLTGTVGGVELTVVWDGRKHNWEASWFNGKHFKNIAVLLRLIAAAA